MSRLAELISPRNRCLNSCVSSAKPCIPTPYRPVRSWSTEVYRMNFSGSRLEPWAKLHSKFMLVEVEGTCSKPRQKCFGNRIEHCLHYTYLSHQWRRSRRHWEILDEEGTLISDISPERLYHSRSRFWKKLMVSVGVSWSGKTYIFFIDPQKTKVDKNCYSDLSKTSFTAWMS